MMWAMQKQQWYQEILQDNGGKSQHILKRQKHKEEHTKFYICTYSTSTLCKCKKQIFFNLTGEFFFLNITLSRYLHIHGNTNQVKFQSKIQNMFSNFRSPFHILNITLCSYKDGSKTFTMEKSFFVLLVKCYKTKSLLPTLWKRQQFTSHFRYQCKIFHKQASKPSM